MVDFSWYSCAGGNFFLKIFLVTILSCLFSFFGEKLSEITVHFRKMLFALGRRKDDRETDRKFCCVLLFKVYAFTSFFSNLPPTYHS